MNYTTVNSEIVKRKASESAFTWFLLAFALGLTLRLVTLDSMVYTQNELVLVNQALQVLQKIPAATSTVPVYTGLTGWLFFLFGAGNFLARLLPALAGASLVLLPWAWKDHLGQKAALILSFALAFEPTFLVFSRAIHGGIFAIAGLLWAFTFLKQNKAPLAGFALAVALLSGAAFWSFLLIIGLSWLAAHMIQPDLAKQVFVFRLADRNQAWFSFGVTFFASSILILTSLLLNPSGLGGVASGLIAFAQNFVLPFEKPIYHSIYLLLAHSILPLILFLVGYSRTQAKESDGWYKIAGVSVIISLIISLVISRETFELLLWPVFVLWLGGAVWLGQWQLKLQGSWLSTNLLRGFVLAILTYLMVNIGRIAEQPLGSPQFWSILLMIAGGIILLISAWWLVKFGWSNGGGNKNILLALLSFLAIVSIGNSTRSLIKTQELRSLEFLDNSLFLPNNDIGRVLDDFALTGKTLPQLGGYELVDLPSEYSWYFRSFLIERNQPNTRVILTRTSNMPERDEEFRGSNVVLERSIDWRKEPLSTYLQALAGNILAFTDQKGVMWIQTNLFTGATN